MTEDPNTATLTRPGALRALPQHCKLRGHEQDAAPEAIGDVCLGPREPHHPGGRRVPSHAQIEARAPTLWRYREWLPFEGEPVHARETGFTPLLEAPRLADLL